MGQAIAFVNQKGGCGKSTASIQAAEWLRQQGHDVLLIDSDAQQSSSKWSAALKNPLPCTILKTANEILDKIFDLVDQHDYLVIDGPAGIDEVTRAILMTCDIAVMPCQPGLVDLESTEGTVRIIRHAWKVRGNKPKALTFVSRARGTVIARETYGRMKKGKDWEGIEVLNTPINNREIITDARGQDATIWDLTTASTKRVRETATTAAGEFEALFKAILEASNDE